MKAQDFLGVMCRNVWGWTWSEIGLNFQEKQSLGVSKLLFNMQKKVFRHFCLLGNLELGPPRGKRDGVIWHILERENGHWMKKLGYFVNDQSGIQRDWVNLAWTWISGNFWAWFVQNTCVKAGFRVPLGALEYIFFYFRTGRCKAFLKFITIYIDNLPTSYRKDKSQSHLKVSIQVRQGQAFNKSYTIFKSMMIDSSSKCS